MLAVYLMIESKKGMSANQLKRTLAVSYKTAWYLCHRIRKAVEETNPEKLTGTVEMDESYIGGKRRHVGSGFVENKTMVLGALQRGGHVHVKVEKRKKATTRMLKQFIAEQTSAGTNRLMTDDNTAYDEAVRPGIEHDTVNHSKEEWVRGDIHTNGIENVWSLFKRSVVGAFHHVSPKHLENYFNEFDWRFNNRDNPYLFRDTLMRLLKSPRLEFNRLIMETGK
jgi:transposase-like protein